jgi:hypothetical protein
MEIVYDKSLQAKFPVSLRTAARRGFDNFFGREDSKALSQLIVFGSVLEPV